MANVPRRRPLDMLGDMADPGDPMATGGAMGAEPGAAGLPAEDPSQMGAMGAPTGGEGPVDAAGLGGAVNAGEAQPGDLEVEELQAVLADPNTPPDIRAQIQAEIALAARRRLAQGQLGAMGGGMGAAGAI